MSNSFFLKIDQKCLLPIFIAERFSENEGKKENESESDSSKSDTSKPIYLTKVGDMFEYESESIPNVQMVEEIFVSMSDMNMKSFSSDAFDKSSSSLPIDQQPTDSTSSRRQRRLINKSAHEVQQLAKSIMSDTL